MSEIIINDAVCTACGNTPDVLHVDFSADQTIRWPWRLTATCEDCGAAFDNVFVQVRPMPVGLFLKQWAVYLWHYAVRSPLWRWRNRALVRRLTERNLDSSFKHY